MGGVSSREEDGVESQNLNENTQLEENVQNENSNEEMETPEEPVYKKWWFWVIIVVGVLLIAGAVVAAILLTQPSASNRVISGSLSSGSSTTGSSISPPTCAQSNPVGLCYCTGTSGFINALVGSPTNPTKGFSGDGGLAINAQIDGPRMSVFDNANCVLYFYDRENERIRRINMRETNPTITTVVGNGTAAPFPILNTPTTTSLSNVRGLVVLPDGSVLIGQSVVQNNIFGALVLRYDPSLNTLNFFTSQNVTGTSSGTTAGQATFQSIDGMVADGSGNVYISDTNVVRKISASSGIVSGASTISDFAGNRTNESPYLANGATNLLGASIGTISTLDVDSNSNLYVDAFTDQRVIYRFNSAGNSGNIFRSSSNLVIIFFAINRLNNELWYAGIDRGLYSIPLSNGSATPTVRCQPSNTVGAVNVLAANTTYGSNIQISFDNFGNCYCSIETASLSAIRRVTSFQLA